MKSAKFCRVMNELSCVILFLLLVFVSLNGCNADDRRDLNRAYTSYEKLSNHGRYAEAIPYAKQALEIGQRLYGEEHEKVAILLNNLAVLYREMGEYDKALPLCQQALEMRKKLLGEEHPVATSLNNLAFLYYSMGLYEKALPLYQQALEIFNQVYGEEHPDVATSLSNLALLYKEMGEYEKSLPLYQQALEMRKKLLGEEHPDVAISLNNLAELYREMGEYDKALPLYQQALEILKQVYGEEHPYVATSLSSLALLYVATEKLENALAAFSEAGEVHEHQCETLLPTLSEREMLSFVQKDRGSLYGVLYAVTSLCSIYPNAKAKELAFKTALQSKGIVFSALSQQIKLNQIEDIVLQEKMVRLRSIQAQLSRLFLSGRANLPVQEYWNKLHQLNEEKEELESEIARRIKELAPTREPMRVSVDDVAKAIPENYALVEFVRFYPYNFKAIKDEKRWGDARYLGFVLHRGGSEPEIIDLGLAEEIEALFKAFMEEVKTPRLGGLASLRKKGQALRKRVFEPLLPALGQTKRVILSPDGMLNLLSFAILPDEKNGFLADTYHFHYVSSGRNLLTWETVSDKKPNPPVVFADPDFDLSLQPPKGSGQKTAMTANRRSRDHRGLKFDRLSGTVDESDSINKTLSEKGLTPKLYIQANAREEYLKQIQSPRILHVATHAFFLEDLDWGITDTGKGIGLMEPNHIAKNLSTTTIILLIDTNLENPLLRSGLALAGANIAGGGKGEDGILTALESSALNLQGTEVIVLSACETGLGEIKTGEGVYGLRRSFQLAGAQTVIASLWRVSDEYTAELMSDFYSRWLGGADKNTALLDSALSIRKRKPHPHYWGAFICLGQM